MFVDTIALTMKNHSVLYLVKLVENPHFNQAALTCFENAHEYHTGVQATNHSHL